MFWAGSTVFVSNDTHTTEDKAIVLLEQQVEDAVSTAATKLRKSNSQRWRDPDFGPNALDPNGAKSLYKNQQPPGPGYPRPSLVSWARASYDGSERDVDGDLTWCSRGRLFKRPLRRCGLVQGRLGDGWLMGVLGMLASSPNEAAITSLFWQRDRFKHLGIYVCRIRKNSRWHYVMVDDSIPVLTGSQGGICFARSSDPNEMWVSLIEKAYAKLHGSYDGLIGGHPEYALRDLTGMCCETTGLYGLVLSSRLANNKHTELKELWDKVKALHQTQGNSLLGCSTVPDRTSEESSISSTRGTQGLVLRHIYPVIMVGQVGEQRLVQLLNPWGFGNWAGRWGTTSREWLEYARSIKTVFGENAGTDGTFLMAFEDWAVHFNTLYTAQHLAAPWSGFTDAGQWTVDTAGGNSRCATWFLNPTYRFRIREAVTEVLVEVYQVDSRFDAGASRVIDRLIGNNNNNDSKFNYSSNLSTTIGSWPLGSKQNGQFSSGKINRESSSHGFNNETKTKRSAVHASGFSLCSLDSNGIPNPLNHHFASPTSEGLQPLDLVPGSIDPVSSQPKQQHQPSFGFFTSACVRVTLKAGDYAVVPCMFDRIVEGDYRVTVWFSQPATIEKGIIVTPTIRAATARVRTDASTSNPRLMNNFNSDSNQVDGFDESGAVQLTLDENKVGWGLGNNSSSGTSSNAREAWLKGPNESVVRAAQKIESARDRMLDALIRRDIAMDRLLQVFKPDKADTLYDLYEVKQLLVGLGFSASDLPEFDFEALGAKNERLKTQALTVVFQREQMRETLLLRQRERGSRGPGSRATSNNSSGSNNEGGGIAGLAIEDDMYFRPISEVPGIITIRMIEASGLHISNEEVAPKQSINSNSFVSNYNAKGVLPSLDALAELDRMEQVHAKLGKVASARVVVRIWRYRAGLRENNQRGLVGNTLVPTLYNISEKAEYGVKGWQFFAEDVDFQNEAAWTDMCDQMQVGERLKEEDAEGKCTWAARTAYVLSVLERRCDVGGGNSRSEWFLSTWNNGNSNSSSGDTRRVLREPPSYTQRVLDQLRPPLEHAVELGGGMREEQDMKTAEHERVAAFQNIKAAGEAANIVDQSGPAATGSWAPASSSGPAAAWELNRLNLNTARGPASEEEQQMCRELATQMVGIDLDTILEQVGKFVSAVSASNDSEIGGQSKGNPQQLVLSRMVRIPGESKVIQRELASSASLRSWFSRFDSDESGTIEVAELEHALKTLDFDLTPEEAKVLMDRFDDDANGCIEYKEFVDFVKNESVRTASDLLKLVSQNADLARLDGLESLSMGSSAVQCAAFASQLRRLTWTSDKSRGIFAENNKNAYAYSQRISWVFGHNAGCMAEFLKRANDVSLDVTYGRNVLFTVLALFAGQTTTSTSAGDKNEFQKMKMKISDGSRIDLDRAMSAFPLSMGNVNAHADVVVETVLCRWLEIQNEANDDTTNTNVQTIEQQLQNAQYVFEDVNPDEPHVVLPLGVQLRVLLDNAGMKNHVVSKACLTRVVMADEIQTISRKLRYVIRQREAARAGAVWFMVDCHILRCQSQEERGLAVHVSARNPNNGEQYTLQIDDAIKLRHEHSLLPTKGVTCFTPTRIISLSESSSAAGNQRSIPDKQLAEKVGGMSQLESALSGLIARLCFVKEGSKQVLALVEAPSVVARLGRLFRNADLSMFVNVSRTALKFSVSVSAMDAHRGALKRAVLSAIRSRPALVHELQNMQSVLRVVLKQVHGFHKETFSWPDFVWLLRGSQNPFVVAELRPGNQVVATPVSEDGGENPVFDWVGQVRYEPTKQAYYSRKLQLSHVSRLDGKYMIVMVYDVETNSGTTLRRAFAYDPATQCEYHVKRPGEPGGSEGLVCELAPGETWGEWIQTLGLGDPITPCLTIRVLNKQAFHTEEVGSAEIPLTTATENPGVASEMWVSVKSGHTEKGVVRGRVHVVVQFDRLTRTRARLDALQQQQQQQQFNQQYGDRNQLLNDSALLVGDKMGSGLPGNRVFTNAEDQRDGRYFDDEDDVVGTSDDFGNIFNETKESNGLFDEADNAWDAGIRTIGDQSFGMVDSADRKALTARERAFEAMKLREDVQTVAQRLADSERHRSQLEQSCRAHEVELRRARREAEQQQDKIIDLTKKASKEKPTRPGQFAGRQSHLDFEEKEAKRKEELRELKRLEQENKEMRGELERRGDFVSQEVQLLRKQLAQKEVDLRNEGLDKQRRLAETERDLARAQSEAAKALEEARRQVVGRGMNAPTTAGPTRLQRTRRLEARQKRELRLQASMGPQYKSYVRDLQNVLIALRSQLERRRPEDPDRALASLDKFLTLQAQGPPKAAGKLPCSDFEEALLNFGLRITAHEADMLGTHFDTEGDDGVDVDEFMDGIRGQVGDVSGEDGGSGGDAAAVGSGVNAVRASQWGGYSG